MRTLACLTIMAAICAAPPAMAGKADIKILGPDKVPAYKFVRLTVSGDGKIVTATRWEISPEPGDKEATSNGILFVAPPGEYKVTLYYIDDRKVEGREIERTTKTVTIGGPEERPKREERKVR